MKKNPFAHGLKASNPVIADPNFLVKLVDSQEELEEVCRLRFDVFFGEMGDVKAENIKNIKNIKKSKIDYDDYDNQNAHLIVIDKSNNKIIATYRMQTYAMAKAGHGFSSADRFDFSEFPLSVQEHSLEVARACIHKSYRNSKVFFLLWKGLAAVLYQNRLRYFFGCSFAADYGNPAEAKAIIKKIEKMDVHHKRIKLKPLPEFRYECDENIPPAKKSAIPSLLNRYLRFKCQICSEPCLNTRFLAIEFLVIYDARCASDEYYRMFFGDKPRIF